MVMKRSMMAKNLRQSIFHSLGRFIAIAMIIALGSGMFVGLRATKADMVATGQEYTDDQNMFDLRLLTSYGWGKEQVAEISKLDGIADAEGVFYTDLILSGDNGADSVYRFYTIPEKINTPVLKSGRMPEQPDECLADGQHTTDSILGTTITVADSNDADSLEVLNYRTFTVVGRVSTPLYMDTTRGSTSVGNGSLANYFFVPESAFDTNYYTEIYVTIPGDYAIYSDAYNTALEDAADAIAPLLEPFAAQRLKDVRQEAENQYSEGAQEYSDACRDYAQAKEDAEQQLHDGFQELLDGEESLRSAQRQLEDAEQQLEDAKTTVSESRISLKKSRKTLAASKSDAYSQISEASQTLMENYTSVSESMLEVNGGLTEIESKSAEVDAAVTQLQALVAAEDAAVKAAQLALDYAQQFGASEETIVKLQSTLEEATAQRDENQALLDEAVAGQEELAAKKAELEAAKLQLENAQDQIQTGLLELTQNQALADKQFSAAEEQITAAEELLDAYEAQFPEQEQQIADGWEELKQRNQEYLDGKKEYREARNKALQELADGQVQLDEAKEELADARQTIRNMTENDVTILDRNSNVGYSALDSNSDIVAGVSRVFPVFFLLVAALVCITTMTRMVDEERTQIGTLKALGYGNVAIISKYLIYAGSTAVFGCLLGTAAGSVIFPKILWEAYKIIMYVRPEICLQIDVPLCAGVFLMYTGAMLLATWYCCRRSLQEVPAELIRPKAPSAGKQLVFERLPIWNRLSFLNKVAVRNIFRYRQRLAMMLLGIGGCTALLLTGFGVRDTIVHIVDTQFQQVTLYDMTVYFEEGQTEEQKQMFLSELQTGESGMFFYQSSVELAQDGTTKDIYLVAAGDELVQFLDLHDDSQPIPFPEDGDVILSVGVAEALDIQVGDTIALRNPDLQTLTVTVAGIFDNYVYNYAIVNSTTLQQQWGEIPLSQMAYVRLADGEDAYTAGARVSALDGVMNVSVNEELAAMVSGMMDAMDLVVVVIVFCAALLAVVVLYNLTNINVNERLREIATIKVLGFTARETGMYVFKENIVLCCMGTLLGLLMGNLLLAFVVDQIRIDMVWFRPRLQILSYVWSVLLTILTALLVDALFYGRLDRINMAEALKSVE